MLLLAACGASAGEVHGDTSVADEPSSTTTTVGPKAEEPVADGELHVIVMPNADGSIPADITIGCPSGPSFPASALEDIPPVEDVDLPGLDDAMQSFLDDEEGQFWPQEGWRLLDESDTTATLVHHDSATNAISFMDLEVQDGVWRWAGASSGGSCVLQTGLPEGLGVVTWRLDPSVDPPTAESTSIAVLVTERACASGRPMGDRLLGPEVILTDTEVLIAFAARSLVGFQECPGNPEQPVVVELPEAIGGRMIIDGLDTGLDLADFLE